MPNTLSSYALPFATWEVRLYLDTHPQDADALALYQRLCSESEGMCNYACLCVNDAGGCPARWSWLDNPWPWEPEANQPAMEV